MIVVDFGFGNHKHNWESIIFESPADKCDCGAVRVWTLLPSETTPGKYGWTYFDENTSTVVNAGAPGEYLELKKQAS